MNILQISELLYNISFIILTILLLIYTIKTYYNVKKQPYKLIARINYGFLDKDGDAIPVVLDIINCGDYAAERIEIRLIEGHSTIDLDRINFIAPKENFRFYLGRLIDKQIILFNGNKWIISDPLDYSYFQLETNNNVVVLTIRGEKYN